jgi:nucleoside-diphosphate-sugar epimerase
MPNKQKTIIITGASGFLGSNLVKHFSKAGWQVRALVRDAKKYSSSKNIEYINWDLKDQKVSDSIFKNADYLVHTAYIKYNRQNPDAMAVNVAAARKLIALSRKYKLSKNVFISTMSAHAGAQSVYGKQKLKIEKLFNTKSDVVIRSGLIIGDGGIVKQMADFMKTKHVVPLVGGGNQPLQVIGVNNLIEVIDHVLSSKVSGMYTVATSEVYSYKEFYKTLAKSLGVKVIFVPFPYFVLETSVDVISFLHIPLSVSKDNVLGLKMLVSVDNSKDIAKLGVKIDPLAKALKEI